MSQQTPGKRAGRVFMVLAWCAALFLATRFFGQLEERQQNPNVVVTSEQGEGFIEVKLVGNTQGHFVASGQINGQPVNFMLDTGATDVAIPAEMAERLKLEQGFGVTLSTANGRTEVIEPALTGCNWATLCCVMCAPSSCQAWMAIKCCSV